MTTQDLPYPNALLDRLERTERRVDNHDLAISALNTTQAVQSERYDGLREDIQDLRKRVSGLVAAIGALVLVLLPIAYDVIK